MKPNAWQRVRGVSCGRLVGFYGEVPDPCNFEVGQKVMIDGVIYEAVYRPEMEPCPDKEEGDTECQ